MKTQAWLNEIDAELLKGDYDHWWNTWNQETGIAHWKDHARLSSAMSSFYQYKQWPESLEEYRTMRLDEEALDWWECEITLGGANGWNRPGFPDDRKNDAEIIAKARDALARGKALIYRQEPFYG